MEIKKESLVKLEELLEQGKPLSVSLREVRKAEPEKVNQNTGEVYDEVEAKYLFLRYCEGQIQNRQNWNREIFTKKCLTRSKGLRVPEDFAVFTINDVFEQDKQRRTRAQIKAFKKAQKKLGDKE